MGEGHGKVRVMVSTVTDLEAPERRIKVGAALLISILRNDPYSFLIGGSIQDIGIP